MSNPVITTVKFPGGSAAFAVIEANINSGQVLGGCSNCFNSNSFSASTNINIGGGQGATNAAAVLAGGNHQTLYFTAGPGSGPSGLAWTIYAGTTQIWQGDKSSGKFTLDFSASGQLTLTQQ